VSPVLLPSCTGIITFPLLLAPFPGLECKALAGLSWPKLIVIFWF